MIYNTAQDWRDAAQKRVLLFAMSGLGKTHLSNMLRDQGNWFHYSVDYRIGTRYMGELIADNAKRHAMSVPFLAELLKSDSIYIASNITFDNLAPLSAYLGKPGAQSKGGLPFEEYRKRQDQHRSAEIASLLDTAHFIERAQLLYNYPNFICDSGGSICEVVDPDNSDDQVLKALSDQVLMVWIEGSEAHTEELIARFDKAPKPMYYQPAFLLKCWEEFLNENNVSEADVDPDTFVRWTYAKAMAHRQPIYQKMAEKWGVTVSATEAAEARDPASFEAMIASALERRAATS